MAKTALVLEGGGMRGIFTAGVLEAFLAHNVKFDHVYGISAGATAAVTFMSGQVGRNKRVFSEYVNDPRYKGIKHWITTGCLFNREFIFETIPEQLDPFDYEAYQNNSAILYAALTDCATGESSLVEVPSEKKAMRRVLEAATSLPVLSTPVKYNGRVYLDGGIAIPLLYDEVLSKDYDRIVYVLTQKPGYQKKPETYLPLIKLLYRKYPKVAEHIKVRHEVYNRRLRQLEERDGDGRLFVIRPSDNFAVKRIEKDFEAVMAGYQDGYSAAERYLKANQ